LKDAGLGERKGREVDGGNSGEEGGGGKRKKESEDQDT